LYKSASGTLADRVQDEHYDFYWQAALANSEAVVKSSSGRPEVVFS
jgi:hypothetical protein